MANPNLAAIMTDAWDMITTLSGYGLAPLTVGWWRGQAYVYLWDFRRGTMTWRPFTTLRKPTSRRSFDPFNSRTLFDALR
jgi:hypothetical protein